MTKTIDSLVQADFDSGNFPGVILTKLMFPTPQRYCNAFQNIYWDEAGQGEQEYIGVGNLASMSVLTETSDLAAQTIQLTLSGIPNATITNIFDDEYIGKALYIWYATLDEQTYAVRGGQNGPVLLFAGRMDFGNIEFGQTATIVVNATSRLADWERPRGGRFNHAYQTRHIDAEDIGFQYVEKLQNKPIEWGGITLADPGSDPVDRGGGTPGPGDRDNLRDRA